MQVVTLTHLLLLTASIIAVSSSAVSSSSRLHHRRRLSSSRSSSASLSAKAFSHASRSSIARRQSLQSKNTDSNGLSQAERFGGLAALSSSRQGDQRRTFSLSSRRRSGYGSRGLSSLSSQRQRQQRGRYSTNGAGTGQPQFGALKEGRTGVMRFREQAARPATRPQPHSRSRGATSRINIESKITAPLPPKPHLETIIVGETAILHCSFENVVKIGEFREAQIWWTKMPKTASGRAVVLASGSQVRIPDDRLKVVSFPDNGFSVLVIRNTVEEDSAEYKCSIPTVSGYKIGYQTLQVEAAPDSRVQSNEKERVVKAGDKVPFHCIPNFPRINNNVLSVWWTAKGPTGVNLKLNGNQDKYLGKRFSIESIDKAMEGIYTCHVENPEGLPIRKHFSVVLKEAPWKIEAYKQNLNVDTMLSRYTKDARVGERVNLRCDSGGNPEPVVRWMKNGKQLAPQQNKVYISSYKPSYRPNAIVSKLLVSNFGLIDQGSYTCIVENELGALERSFEVKVADNRKPGADVNEESNFLPEQGTRDQYQPSRRQETVYRQINKVTDDINDDDEEEDEDVEGSGGQ